MSDFAIIIPCYNAENTIAKALESVSNQTYKNWTIYIVDDGSSDRTLSVVETFCASHDNIHVLGQFNRGVSHARNRGIQNARGKYIAFLDADDEWPSNRLEVLANAFKENRDADILYGRVKFFQQVTGELGSVSTVKQGILTLLDLLSENLTCSMSNVTIRSAALEKNGLFNISMTHGEDREWLLRAIVNGLEIHSVDQILTYYRLSQDGLSADLEKMYDGWKQSVEMVAKKDASLSTQQLNEAEAVYLRYLARRALRTGIPTQYARRYVLKSLSLSPSKYFENFKRGLATFVGAFGAGILPQPIRTAIFAR